MARVRGLLRGYVLAWLVFQATSLSLALPGYCCSDHAQPPASAVKANTCHESKPQPPQPMDCSLRGSCTSPIAAILSLLANQGILAPQVTATPTLALAPLSSDHAPHALSLQPSPDAPPPRA